MSYFSRKILLWGGSVSFIFIVTLWSIGHFFKESGVLVIAKEKALALTGNLSEFTKDQTTNTPKKLPEAKDSEAVAKNLLIDLVALKQSGASTEDTRKDLANKLYLEAELDKPFLFTAYTRADLKIVPNGELVEQNYKKELTSLFKKNHYKGLGDEVEIWILSKAGGVSEQEAGKRILEKSYTSYQNITEALRSLSVPENTLVTHLSVLNIFKALADTTRAMNITDDVVTSLPAIQFFYESILGQKTGI